jgi:hypothetical protein
MKSSFKKMYEMNQQPDGSVELVVKGSRSGAFGIASNPGPVAFLLIMIYVGCFIGISFLGIKMSGNRFMDIHIGKVALIALIGPFTLLKFAFGARRNAILIQTKGLVFGEGKKQIALGDIKNFGVMTESVSGNGGHAQSSYVYVDALGQRIKITGHMTQELAEAVRDEIVGYYDRK